MSNVNFKSDFAFGSNNLNESFNYDELGRTWSTKKTSRSNLNSHLVNSSYSFWKTEPTPEFNSVSFYWNSKTDRKYL
jgi:hypothetical protein